MRYLIIVVLIVLAVVGYYRDWFEFSTNKGPNESQSTASVTLNRDKVSEDVNAFGAKVREGVNTIVPPREQKPSAVAESTTRGQIEKVGQGKLLVRTPDDQVMTFGIVPKTEIKVGERPATMADLRKDDPVSVVHTDDEERHVAVSVTVENRQ